MFGPSGTSAELEAWLADAGMLDVSTRSDGALAYFSARRNPWNALGRSYRCQVRVRLIAKPGLPHMMVVATRGRGCVMSARSARRELKTSRAM